jgi:F0F1-type ATP synthase beta subunit
MYVLFLLLVHVYKFLNHYATSETIVVSIMINFEANKSRVGSLYNLMETNKEMVLLVVKEHLKHYRIRKVSDEECKNLLAWWKVHESQFSYVVFVARHILGIVGSQIESERVFNIVGICTNMQWSIWGIQNLEMLVNIYKI